MTNLSINFYSYKKQFLKIYVFKFLRIFVGILSLWIVIPIISQNKSLYGIYSLCMSLSIFLQYADIGFIDAGQKYASEKFAKNDLQAEIRILSFVFFIMTIFVCAFIGIGLWFSYNPRYLIKNLNEENIKIASNLIFILTISSPIVILQRICQSIFTIRFKDYTFHIIDIVFNLFKISSVYIFFNSKINNIVGYYLFTQIMNLFTVITALFFIKYLFNYNFIYFIKNFKFSSEVYQSIKKMVYGTLFATIAWTIFNYSDTILIAKTLNENSVAVYSIGLTIMTFLASLLNTIYYPFFFRFNNFYAVNDNGSIDKLFINMLKFVAPTFIIITLTVIILMKFLIIGWVGYNYLESVLCAQFLICGIIFLSISTPINHLIIVKEKITLIYISTLILPIIYLVTVFALLSYSSILSFAIAKSASLFLYLIFSIFFIKKLTNNNIHLEIFNIIPKFLITLILFIYFIYLFIPYVSIIFPKNIYYTVKVVLLGFFISLITLLFYYFINNTSRDYILKLIKNLKY
jgi:O-antigen/teichoic acid export membrane protein